MSLDKNLFQQPSNKLLAAMPASDYQRLVPHLKLVPLEVPQILYQAGEPMTHVYFPEKSMVSIVTTMEDGSTVEVGIVSNYGGYPGNFRKQGHNHNIICADFGRCYADECRCT